MASTELIEVVTLKDPELGSSKNESRNGKSSGKARLRWKRALQKQVSKQKNADDDGDPLRTGLHQAVRDDITGAVNKWMEHLNDPKCKDMKSRKLNEKDEHGMAPVHYATKFNRYEILKTLSKNGADLKLTSTEEEYTPLHFAASYVPRYKLRHDIDVEGSISLAHKSYLTSSKDTIKFLITKQVEVSAKDKNHVRPLHLACRRGNLEAALLLLKQSNIECAEDFEDAHKDTPLHQACAYGHEEIVDELLKIEVFSKSLHSLCNKEDQTPLHLACQEGHTVIVRKLLEKCPPSERKKLLEVLDIEGKTALHLAVESLRLGEEQEPEIVKTLLEYYEAGTDRVQIVKKKSKKYRTVTPLHLAARYGLVNVIGLLLDPSRPVVYINAITEENQTPLHFAAKYNQPSAVEELITRGASTKWKDVNSYTPFLMAAANGATDVVAKLEQMKEKQIQYDKLDKNRKSAVFLAAEGDHLTLLKHLLGSSNCRDPHLIPVTGSLCTIEVPTELTLISRKLCSTPDVDLNTPLHIAAKLGHDDIMKELMKDKLLDSKLVKLDTRNQTNKTPAHLAAEYGHIDILDKLTSENCHLVFDEDDDGNTPLHLAARHGWKRSVELLLEKKANIDAKNADLATPLSLAAGSGHKHVVKLLLQSKAEIDVQDRSQATPLHYAIKKGHVHIVKVFLRNGASCSLRNKDSCNALDYAIESGHEDVARVIIQSDQWEDALKNQTDRYGTREQTTPFRKLIRRMPDVAREVLNRCTVYKDEPDGKSVTKYNYQYLEDFATPDADNFSPPKGPLKYFLKPFMWCTKHLLPTGGYQNDWGPEKFNRSNHPLSIMAKSKDSRLISHPLVISLLMFKLRNYASTCYLLQALLPLLLLIFLIVFALTVINPNTTICRVVLDGQYNILNTRENTSEICESDEAYKNGTILAQCGLCDSSSIKYYYVVLVIAAGVFITALLRIVILLFRIVNYSRQIKLTLWSFLTDFQNWPWIELPMLICSIIFVSVFRMPCQCPTTWQWQIGVFAMLFAWFDLIIFIRSLQLFDIGIYILMFGDIFLTFIRTLLLLLLLLFAFFLAFFMAFHVPGTEFASSPFASPGQTMVTVWTYVTGGGDYNSLFRLSHEPRGSELVTSRPFLPISILLWIIFLIMMVILFINMLIGLSVEDIKGIRRAAEVQRLKILVNLTLSIDSILPYRHLLIIPEGTSMRKKSLWNKFNDFLWEGKIEQDTPEKIAETLAHQTEVNIHTNSLVKDVTAMRITIKALNERNRRMETALEERDRRMEATLLHISKTLGKQFDSS